MALTVSYEFDKALRLVELLANNLYDFKVCLLIVSTYVVNLSYTSVVDDKVDCLAMILYIEPVTYILPVPYTGSGLPLSAFAIISGISFSGKWYGP